MTGHFSFLVPSFFPSVLDDEIADNHIFGLLDQACFSAAGISLCSLVARAISIKRWSNPGFFEVNRFDTFLFSIIKFRY